MVSVYCFMCCNDQNLDASLLSSSAVGEHFTITQVYICLCVHVYVCLLAANLLDNC